MKSSTITRRDFCLRAAQASFGLAITGMALHSEGSASHEVTIDLTQSANSVLTTAGGAMYMTMPSSGTLVIVVRNSETEVSAFSSVCTHSGCRVGLPVNGVATCPCHGSRFSDTGAVQRGPATTDLKKLYATLEGNNLYIGSTPTSVGRNSRPSGNSKVPLNIVHNRGSATVSISWKRGSGEPLTLLLDDISGRRIDAYKWDGTGTFAIPVDRHSPGMYLLEARSAAGRVSVKSIRLQ